MRHNFTHPTVKESLMAENCFIPQDNMYISLSRQIGLNDSFFGVRRSWRALCRHKGSLPARNAPKPVAIETSGAIFGVTFVYRVLRVITTQIVVRFARGLLTQFCRLSRFLSIVCCPLPLIMAQHTVPDTEIEPPHAGIG